MLCINSPWVNGSYSYFRFILTFNMPKYAVAIGKKVGIYDSWNECSAQVRNFPNAKFRKFDNMEEAEAFIKKFSSSTKIQDSGPIVPIKVENANPPELIKLEKISPRTDFFVLMNRLTSIEERLGHFITETTSKMEMLLAKVNNLEGKRTSEDMMDNLPPPKKRKENKSLFDSLNLNENGFVKVFTDGACSKNGQTGAMAGIGIWFNTNHPLNISAPVQGPATNNNAEIQAARVAITQAHHAGIRKIAIHTDSKFVIDCITQWTHKWKKNDWKLSTGGPVKNKDELVKLDKAVQLLEVVEWNYVAGHRGIEGNEMADRLAREGASRYKKNIVYGNNAKDVEVKYYTDSE